MRKIIKLFIGIGGNGVESEIFEPETGDTAWITIKEDCLKDSSFRGVHGGQITLKPNKKELGNLIAMLKTIEQAL